jgi:hypothetical protein
MKEIKSVRVRKKFSSGDDNRGFGDYKVILYDDGRRKFKVFAGQIGRPFLNSEYRREGRFENYSDDDFIKDGIVVLISKQNANAEFEIVQDPWLDNPPKWRSYGYDPYYLNNGSQVYINWFDGSLSAGGKMWSDDDGKELSTSKNGDDRGLVTKIVTIWAPDSYKGQNKRLKMTELGIKNTLDKDGKAIDFNDETKYAGSMPDDEIIKSIITRWNSQVPNYNLSLCEPVFRRCEIIPYISPDEELVDIEEKLEEPSQEPVVQKEKLNVIIPKDLKLKIKQDFSFKIFVGDPPKTELPVVDGFDFGDEEDLSDLLLEDEFKESEFQGDGENLLTIEEQKKEEEQAKIDLNNAGIPASSISIPQGSYTVSNIEKSTPFSSTTKYPPSFNGIPIYSQYDTRWSSSPFDYIIKNGKKNSCNDNSTVASSGCGPTAVSMVINFWASKGYCKPTLPSIVAKFFSDFGGRVCGSGSGLYNVPRDKFKQTFGLVINPNGTVDSLFKSLQNGYPCVVSIKNARGYNFKGDILSGKYKGGHFICLTGIDNNGLIRINDSGNGPTGGKSITSFVTKGKEALSKDIGVLNQKALIYPESLSNTIV